MRKTLVALGLLLALCAPLTLSAATLPPSLTSPAADAACPPASTASTAPTSGDLLQALALTAPPAEAKTVYTIGRCSGSCDPATCVKGPLGICKAATCYMGVSGMCPAGQYCVRTCDDLP
jgi:hypothetical protein